MKMTHSCLRVLDLERSKDFYEQAFQLREAERYSFESFTLLYLRDKESEFELELTSNHDRKEPYELGDGYAHLAFLSADLDGDRDRVLKAGGQPGNIKSLDHQGKLLGRFFFATDPDGYKIEVLAREGRFASL